MEGETEGEKVPPMILNSQFPKSDDLMCAGDQLTDFHAHVRDQSCRNDRLHETWSWDDGEACNSRGNRQQDDGDDDDEGRG